MTISIMYSAHYLGLHMQTINQPPQLLITWPLCFSWVKDFITMWVGQLLGIACTTPRGGERAVELDRQSNQYLMNLSL